MSQSTIGIEELQARMLRIQGDMDALREQIHDIALSEDDKSALDAYLAEKRNGELFSDRQVHDQLEAA